MSPRKYDPELGVDPEECVTIGERLGTGDGSTSDSSGYRGPSEAEGSGTAPPEGSAGGRLNVLPRAEREGYPAPGEKGDCPAEHRERFYCTLDAGHEGPHVAHITDDSVVATWTDEPGTADTAPPTAITPAAPSTLAARSEPRYTRAEIDDVLDEMLAGWTQPTGPNDEAHRAGYGRAVYDLRRRLARAEERSHEG